MKGFCIFFADDNAMMLHEIDVADLSTIWDDDMFTSMEEVIENINVKPTKTPSGVLKIVIGETGSEIHHIECKTKTGETKRQYLVREKRFIKQLIHR